MPDPVSTEPRVKEILDDFTGPALDMQRWQFLRYPLADGGTWVCAEPAAETTVGDGEVRIRVPRFTNAHDHHQNIDNCKHLLLAARALTLPDSGRVTFSTTLSARSLNATPQCYRDGFVSFNVLDFTTGMVFDLCATSDQVIAIYERLPLPGVGRPFTYIIDAPLSGVSVAPGRAYACAITFDVDRRAAEWRVDGALVFEAAQVPVPQAVTLGFGFISLHPLADGRSTSLHGQGLEGSWRAFEMRTEEAL